MYLSKSGCDCNFILVNILVGSCFYFSFRCSSISNFSVLNLIDSRLHINFVDQVLFVCIYMCAVCSLCVRERMSVYVFSMTLSLSPLQHIFLFSNEKSQVETSDKLHTARCLPIKIEYNLILSFSFIFFTPFC